jgi:hypothetical protein
MVRSVKETHVKSFFRSDQPGRFVSIHHFPKDALVTGNTPKLRVGATTTV